MPCWPDRKIVILVDSDGDEFPLFQWREDSIEDVLRRAEKLVAAGDWRPNGPLLVDRIEGGASPAG